VAREMREGVQGGGVCWRQRERAPGRSQGTRGRSSCPPFSLPATPPPQRNVEQYPSAELTPGVLVVRLDAPVFFANVHWMATRLEDYEAEAEE
jgi:MFS superfamily sulfate permease-like transporter